MNSPCPKLWAEKRRSPPPLLNCAAKQRLFPPPAFPVAACTILVRRVANRPLLDIGLDRLYLTLKGCGRKAYLQSDNMPNSVSYLGGVVA